MAGVYSGLWSQSPCEHVTPCREKVRVCAKNAGNIVYHVSTSMISYTGVPRRELNRMADPATLPVSDATSADPSTGAAGASVSLEFEPSSQQADMAQGTALAAPPTAASGVMGVVSSVRERGSRLLQTQKPWSELFDRTQFSKPTNIGEATSR